MKGSKLFKGTQVCSAQERYGYPDFFLEVELKHIDVSRFQQVAGVLGGTQWLLVVKSVDQINRRQRMLASRRGERFGRLQPRPTAVGLLVLASLEDNIVRVRWKREFREPRHIQPLCDDRFLLTEMNHVLQLDVGGEVQTSYSHPFFAFLHTVDVRSNGTRALIVSSGYDSVFELDLKSGEETFRWFGWDHGFNPDKDGVWLTADRSKFDCYCKEGKKALLIDPVRYGKQGLVTSRRSAHPNAAVFDPFDGENSFIVSIGHTGKLYRVDMSDCKTELVCDLMGQMPHGLRAFNDGWVITDTTRGGWWLMDKLLNPKVCYWFKGLGHKVIGTEEVEWLQQVIPVGRCHALALDANRGLIALDLDNERYSIYQPDPEWCIQDALYVSR